MKKKCFPLDLSEVCYYLRKGICTAFLIAGCSWKLLLAWRFSVYKDWFRFYRFFFVFYSSFMATNDKQTNVQLIRKFDDWEYSWWSSLNQRMPWFDAKGTGTKALLTTSSSPTNYPSGSIIWAGTDRHPADWISAVGMRDPGVIWYWVNEDDCDEDRKPGRMFPS